MKKKQKNNLVDLLAYELKTNPDYSDLEYY